MRESSAVIEGAKEGRKSTVKREKTRERERESRITRKGILGRERKEGKDSVVKNIYKPTLNESQDAWRSVIP